jgi:transitional endoplasmic reticulum ATPase
MQETEDLRNYKDKLERVLQSESESKLKISNLKILTKEIIDISKNKDNTVRIEYLKLADSCIIAIDRIMKSQSTDNPISHSRGKDDKTLTVNDSADYFQKLHPAISTTSFEDIAGLEDVKKIVMNQIIKARENREIAKMYGITGRNILLFGPPGTGKTSIAQAISNKVQYPMVTVTPSDILDNKFGEFEKNIRSLFQGAVANKPVILFFDEFESLATRRSSSNSSYMKRGVPEMLRQMTDIRKQLDGKIMIIAATNNPWDVDDAMLNPERFDTKIFVPPPDDDARTQLFRTFLRDLKVEDAIDYDELGRISAGFTGADIKYICKRAAEEVFSEVVDRNEIREINQADIMRSIEKSPKSITSDLLAKYSKFMEKYRI